MQPGKRLGTGNSATRAALIEATCQLVREEGYAAVTSRRLAEKAGLKHQLIYYYFNTLGDLLLEVFRLSAERHVVQLEKALASDEPLHALWELNTDPRSIRFQTEFTAISNHHEAIRTALKAHGERVRSIEAKAIARYLEMRGADAGVSPMVLTVLIHSISNIFLIEQNLGISLGHAETRALLDDWLRTLSSTPPRPA
jgi:AcrR family transcriptional regulator